MAFGVYIIHQQKQIHALFMKDAFTEIALNTPAWLLPVVILAIAAGIYIACSILDWMRLKLFQLVNLA